MVIEQNLHRKRRLSFVSVGSWNIIEQTSDSFTGKYSSYFAEYSLFPLINWNNSG
ncbi:hypothetical protein GCM10008013_33050 [Paenibacillus segetis]|uniref:Uncharacterized protein n=1 Tax=Paenibacillus segetis TaxID=1325360 RepID=A0ABQ1YL31_9BACL|nr:hypothetical protein GCM10008013_33050 [Paenibacillus segetis]